MRRLPGISFLVAISVWLTVSAATAIAPRNGYLLILEHRAGPFAYLRSFEKGGPEAYSDALDAFGTPSSFETDGNLCRVSWKSAGITVGFASALRA